MKRFGVITTLCFAGLFLRCGQTSDNSGSIGKSSSETSKPKELFYSAIQLDSILNTAIRLDSFSKVAVADTSSNQSLGKVALLDKGQDGESYFIAKRTSEGYVELHEQWDDVVVIRSGHGILRTGTKVIGNKLLEGQQPWRNWYGGQIIDPKETQISPGDFIVIPAMTGHQYIPNNNDTLTYWTVKIKRDR